MGTKTLITIEIGRDWVVGVSVKLATNQASRTPPKRTFHADVSFDAELTDVYKVFIIYLPFSYIDKSPGRKAERTIQRTDI